MLGISPAHPGMSVSPAKMKRLQKRRKKKELEEEDVLTSPTAVNMKNSFIIKNAD
jgi:adenosylcobinamide amidohydrolase